MSTAVLVVVVGAHAVKQTVDTAAATKLVGLVRSSTGNGSMPPALCITPSSVMDAFLPLKKVPLAGVCAKLATSE